MRTPRPKPRSPIKDFLLRSPARTAVMSFAVVIMVGTILLCLPVSSEAGQWTAPVDALFTSTSAVCVTGLIVKDTPVYWSTFGEVVIMVLIQMGGLGIMTLGAFLAVMVRQRVSLHFQEMMMDLHEAEDQDVWTLIRFICILTAVVEIIGAALLFFSWRGHFDTAINCAYVSLFHSISAFCNAGFSLYSDSLVRYQGSISINLIMAGLIVMGGIGFMVIHDLGDVVSWHLFDRKGKSPELSTHSKLALTVTAVLLVVGFVVILLVGSQNGMQDLPWKERVLAALFQSVTPRTAGFNTIPMGVDKIAGATAFLLMALMFIGGSPGSTAGGIKTTTLGVMISSVVATLKGRSRAEMFHHSIRAETVHRVASIVLLSQAAVVGGTFLLLMTEDGAGFLEVIFEAISAFGTVGLSVGLTGELSFWGRLIITTLMFLGRLGPITIALSIAGVEDKAPYTYPNAHIMVG